MLAPKRSTYGVYRQRAQTCSILLYYTRDMYKCLYNENITVS